MGGVERSGVCLPPRADAAWLGINRAKAAMVAKFFPDRFPSFTSRSSREIPSLLTALR
jgi:hypothetical protein